jgi:hypothetical protein
MNGNISENMSDEALFALTCAINAVILLVVALSNGMPLDGGGIAGAIGPFSHSFVFLRAGYRSGSGTNRQDYCLLPQTSPKRQSKRNARPIIHLFPQLFAIFSASRLNFTNSLVVIIRQSLNP